MKIFLTAFLTLSTFAFQSNTAASTDNDAQAFVSSNLENTFTVDKKDSKSIKEVCSVNTSVSSCIMIGGKAYNSSAVNTFNITGYDSTYKTFKLTFNNQSTYYVSAIFFAQQLNERYFYSSARKLIYNQAVQSLIDNNQLAGNVVLIDTTLIDAPIQVCKNNLVTNYCRQTEKSVLSGTNKWTITSQNKIMSQVQWQGQQYSIKTRLLEDIILKAGRI
jgi:hypothetical protein